MSKDHEAHEMPLANRLVEDVIRRWLDVGTATALASRGSIGCEPREIKAIEEMRHLQLDDYSYTVVPEILDQLRRAGLMAQEGAS